MDQELVLPPIPAKHADFVEYINSHPRKSVCDLVEPYNEYDAIVRKIFAQNSRQSSDTNGCMNIVPLFPNQGPVDLKVRARDPSIEPQDIKSQYLMVLRDKERRQDGSPAVVSSIDKFQANFDAFCESSLCDINWNNIVVAGSAVATPLIPVPERYARSGRSLRQFYHEIYAPSSDVDLFLYGLSEAQAIQKILEIERCIKSAIEGETLTVRTKNAITVVSQYPVRHVQIVLRLYNSIAEILTGFDVDCACAAYDGRQVYLAPRAIRAYITQTNHVDLSRRSPSYEHRLFKYSQRGFEVFWPELDRSRINPAIFECEFARTVGLARLLVLERLLHSWKQTEHSVQSNLERGQLTSGAYAYPKETEDRQGGCVAEQWAESNYHTLIIPYGKGYNAKQIQRLLHNRDLLLNAKWNSPKNRLVNLHRHPSFFGKAEDIIFDCCGVCPQPDTPKAKEVAAEESKRYVSGDISFLTDNPGRQEIGSFDPIMSEDWTETAYIGRTQG